MIGGRKALRFRAGNVAKLAKEEKCLRATRVDEKHMEINRKS